ncbi:MAG: 3-hydroxy-3-methylglutaryl CoA synthase [Actinomycetia bacterium]|nr:3-hydroxy-3-methylglutaryl CoA synthase [Actinomycetes bacterium]
MRGIISAGGYVPFRRLQRSEIAKTFGSGGGKGTRSVASYDEDTTTMGVEAARLALRSAPDGVRPSALWFSTASPAYLDKNNASTLHAALRLDTDVSAFDFGGALRSGIGALRSALEGGSTTLVVTSDMRGGLPTSADESATGDGAGALLVGDDTAGAVIAEYLGGASTTEEFIERWRTPGSTRSRAWEERFGEIKYGPLVEQAWNAALKSAELSADQVTKVIVTGMHARAVRAVSARLGTAKEALADDRSATVGNTGSAHAALLLADTLESAQPGQVIALVVLADGADVMLFRTTDAIASYAPARTVAAQVEGASDIAYGKFLGWRGEARLEPPRRPEPDRISASVSGRTEEWKYAFVGSRDRSSGELHMPPARVSRVGDAVDDMAPAPMADVQGTIALLTIDRIAYSPSPPVAFAVVDWDGGGRLPVELTDVDAATLQMGDRVEMTFRKLFTSDEIHNYFWKARPVRGS